MEFGIKTLTVEQFLDALGSNSAAPGGGAAAGLSGALGAALGRMVAELTAGRQKYAAWSDAAKDVSDRLAPLTERFLALADRDAEAYSRYMDALALPKNDEAERAARKEAMQRAIRFATEVPCSVVETCLETVALLEQLYGQSNPTCAGDLAAGAAQLQCAAKIAWLNILANLPYYSDPEAAKTILSESEQNLSGLYARCEALYARVSADVRPQL